MKTDRHPRTTAALDFHSPVIEDLCVRDTTFSFEIMLLLEEPDEPDFVEDAGEGGNADELSDAYHEAWARCAWLEVIEDAARRLSDALDARDQTMLPGFEDFRYVARLPEQIGDEYDGPGSIYGRFIVDRPENATEDLRVAAVIHALGQATATMEAKIQAEMAAAKEAAEAAEAEAKALLEAKVTEILGKDKARGTVLVNVAHHDTWNALPKMLGRPVYERHHATERSKGRVAGVSAEEWSRLDELRKSKRIKLTKLRTKDAAGWEPQMEWYQRRAL